MSRVLRFISARFLMRTRYYFLLFLLLAGFLGTGIFVLRERFESGDGMPEYSLYSTSDNGYATAARFLNQVGWQSVGLSRPIQNTRHQGLLIMVEPKRLNPLTGFMEPGVGQEDATGILRWVSQGNTLVLIGRHWTDLHRQLKVDLVGDFAGAKKPLVRTETAREIGGYTEPIDGFGTFPVYNIAVEATDLLNGNTGQPLFNLGGKAGGWLTEHGNGRVILIADPSLWTHRGLTRADNVLLLYNIARMDAVGGRVYFDEYHHGIQSSGGYWDYLRYHDLHWVAVQLALVVALAMWTAAVRLGPALPRPVPPKEDAVDFASGVARIYQRAGVLHQMAAHISRDFLDRINRILRLRRNSDSADVLRTWKQRLDEASTRELSELIQKAETLLDVGHQESEVSRRELLHWAKRFDHFVQKHR